MKYLAGSMLVAVVTCLLSGCGDAPTASAPAAKPKIDYAAEEARMIQEGLAKLSPEDRVKAEAQKVCPVADGPLGGMGMPYKMTVKGRDVFLCCEHCKDHVEKDPDKYLAKLDDEKVESGPSSAQ